MSKFLKSTWPDNLKFVTKYLDNPSVDMSYTASYGPVIIRFSGSVLNGVSLQDFLWDLKIIYQSDNISFSQSYSPDSYYPHIDVTVHTNPEVYAKSLGPNPFAQLPSQEKAKVATLESSLLQATEPVDKKPWWERVDNKVKA